MTTTKVALTVGDEVRYTGPKSGYHGHVGVVEAVPLPDAKKRRYSVSYPSIAPQSGKTLVSQKAEHLEAVSCVDSERAMPEQPPAPPPPPDLVEPKSPKSPQPPAPSAAEIKFNRCSGWPDRLYGTVFFDKYRKEDMIVVIRRNPIQTPRFNVVAVPVPSRKRSYNMFSSRLLDYDVKFVNLNFRRSAPAAADAFHAELDRFNAGVHASMCAALEGATEEACVVVD